MTNIAGILAIASACLVVLGAVVHDETRHKRLGFTLFALGWLVFAGSASCLVVVSQ